MSLELQFTKNKFKTNIRINCLKWNFKATSESNVVLSIEKIYPYIKEFASHQTSSASNVDLDELELFGAPPTRRNRRRPRTQQNNDLKMTGLSDRNCPPVLKKARAGKVEYLFCKF